MRARQAREATEQQQFTALLFSGYLHAQLGSSLSKGENMTPSSAPPLHILPASQTFSAIGSAVLYRQLRHLAPSKSGFMSSKEQTGQRQNYGTHSVHHLRRVESQGGQLGEPFRAASPHSSLHHWLPLGRKHYLASLAACTVFTCQYLAGSEACRIEVIHLPPSLQPLRLPTPSYFNCCKNKHEIRKIGFRFLFLCTL